MNVITSTLDLITRAGKPYSIVLNATPLGGRASHVMELMRGQGFHVLGHHITRRVSLDYCNDDGRTVFEYDPDGKAAQDIEELYKTVAQTMKM